MNVSMFRTRAVALKSVLCCAMMLLAAPTHAAIPSSERSVLLSLYSSAGGSGWSNNSGWNGPAGTECSWNGIVCDAGQTHVVAIALGSNNLVGTLPASLSALTALQSLALRTNQLSGTLPSVAGLTQLQSVDVAENQLSGSLPSLSGLTSLQTFNAVQNQLSGSIPSLAGLSNLQDFEANGNVLSGSLPSLAGLSNLQVLDVHTNQLTGQIPALDGLISLTHLEVSSNQLSGAFPSLAGLTNLQLISISGNQVSGSLPPLTGLTRLQTFNADANQLSGNIPSLADLSNLQDFEASSNALSGSIPPLAGLSNLQTIDVDNNQLTGQVPVLDGLTNLSTFLVQDNLLVGPPPSFVPATLTRAALCPNYLDKTPSAAWDAATGQSPWYTSCLDATTADLAITKSGPTFVPSSAPISYTLTIVNNGPDQADGATYDDALPGGITGIGASCDASGGAVCATPQVNGNDVSGTIPTLPNGGSVTITINGTAPAGPPVAFDNTATVTSPAASNDPDTSNNTSQTVHTTTPVRLQSFEVD